MSTAPTTLGPWPGHDNMMHNADTRGDALPDGNARGAGYDTGYDMTHHIMREAGDACVS